MPGPVGAPIHDEFGAPSIHCILLRQLASALSERRFAEFTLEEMPLIDHESRQ
jgi:hypothetical protein